VTRVRTFALVAVALVTAAICVRLGVWQLQRLAERRDVNAVTAASLARPPIDVAALAADSTPVGRRVLLRGAYDFEHELVLVNRSREGAPGVNLLTPLRVPGRDTAVMVNRGWIYSPDGASIDRTAWPEPREASGIAYVVWPGGSASNGADGMRIDSTRRVLRADPRRIAGALPYPVAPYHLVLLGDSSDARAGYGTAVATDGTTPVRLSLPPLDEGPHKSYAIQWFCFAAIAVVGVSVLIRQDTAGRRGARGPPPE
jgi:surfeit locus 1 family protein